MTFKEMWEEVQLGAGDTSSSFLKVIKRVVNRKRRSIFRLRRSSNSEREFSQALVAGTDEYTLDSTIGYILRVQGADGREIAVMSQTQFSLAGYPSANSSSSAPVVMVMFGRGDDAAFKVRFWPEPVSAETIKIYANYRPAWLTEDSDATEGDDSFDDTVIQEAIAHCKLLRDDQLSETASRRAAGALAGFAQGDKNAEGTERVNQIRPDPVVAVMRAE